VPATVERLLPPVISTSWLAWEALSAVHSDLLMAPTQIRLKPEISNVVQLLLIVAALIWSAETVVAQAPPADPDAFPNGTLLPSSMVQGTPFAWVDYSKRRLTTWCTAKNSALTAGSEASHITFVLSESS
jgi:hypothetical protein